MRLPACSWLALSSLVLSSSIHGAVRPRYGGTLTVQLSTVRATGSSALAAPITETLVRVNSRGEFEPVLAVAWQHDPDFKRWRFSLRPKVLFHDGEPLTGATATPSLLAALKPVYGDVSIEAGGQAIVVQSGRALPDLLEELALPEAAVSRKSDSGLLIGTGPFRLAGREAGRRTILAAFDDYWGGRPYLDAVSFDLAPAGGRAGLIEVPPGPPRNILPEGFTIWSSVPRTLIAIVAANADPALVQALSAAIDTAPIASVLAQHKAEPAFGLLPQWLSGYEFLFQNKPPGAKFSAAPVSLSYPANDMFLRPVAERIALNARDAGIVIQPVSTANGKLQLVEWPLESADAAHELRRMAQRLGAGDRAGQADFAQPESVYQFERSLLEEHRIVPLVHLRESFAVSPRLHFQPSRDQFSLHLEDAWLESP
jgi:Bacterial extracellular solute-binding proteins, family 5 Middle